MHRGIFLRWDNDGIIFSILCYFGVVIFKYCKAITYHNFKLGDDVCDIFFCIIFFEGSRRLKRGRKNLSVKSRCSERNSFIYGIFPGVTFSSSSIYGLVWNACAWVWFMSLCGFSMSESCLYIWVWVMWVMFVCLYVIDRRGG